MGLLDSLLRPRALNPMDDRYYTTMNNIGAVASSGAYVNAETALSSSTVWACTRLIAECIAMMPTLVYRRRSDGGKERAAGHPLYYLLHDSPNELQTAFAWKRTLMTHALLYGGGYSRINAGARGAVDSLPMIHPDNIRTETLPGGGIRYQVRGEDGIEEPVPSEDIFHLPGLSLDGVNGLSLVRYARESIGLALSAEDYSARFYSQSAAPSGILKTAGKLGPESAERQKQRWQDAHSGATNWHKTAVLEEGLEWQQIGVNNVDAELIAQLDWSAADIARFFNVPLHMVQLMTKTTSWGSGIEEMGIEFVVFTLLPWIRNWEQLISKKLILAPQSYFAEFLVDALMRGKLGDRYSAYSIGRNGGWLSVNEIRGLENLNPIPDGDRYLEPLNMQEAGQRDAAEPQPQPEPPDDASAHYRLLLHEAAARVVRKEIAAMTKAAQRCGDNLGAWMEEVNRFYAGHAAFVVHTLQAPWDEAERYTSQQAHALLTQGADAMADWETTAVARLEELANHATEVNA
jgi:HK97 family phage portal protein